MGKVCTSTVWHESGSFLVGHVLAVTAVLGASKCRRQSTYRIFVLNSTAIDCAIVLILLTNSMPASRATAMPRSLSCVHYTRVVYGCLRGRRRRGPCPIRCVPATRPQLHLLDVSSPLSVDAGCPHSANASPRNAIKNRRPLSTRVTVRVRTTTFELDDR